MVWHARGVEREGGGSEVKGGLLGGRLVLIDATTFLVKSYNANARMPRVDGTPTGAVYGFCKLLQELMAEDSECRVVACFSSGDIGRRRLHSEYKSSQTSIPPPVIFPRIPISSPPSPGLGFFMASLSAHLGMHRPVIPKP